MALAAAFSGTPTTGTKELSVVFTDSSTSDDVIIKWLWEFGDGLTSSEQNPTHVYRRAGTYTVALTVWDDAGNEDTETKVAYVVVTAPTDVTSEAFCLRFATEPSEGYGWNLCDGDDWVEPVTDYGLFTILDEYDVPRAIVLDTNDDGIYEVDTYDRIADIKPSPLDKGSTEITWEKWSPEIVVPNGEWAKIEAAVSHVYIRPLDTGNRGETGYTSTGQRDAQEISLDVYSDGEKITPSASAEDVPEAGDLVFSGTKVEARRLQYVIRGTAGELRLTGRRHVVVQKPKTGSRTERTMTEHTAESALSSPVFWLCRRAGRALLYELIGKNTITGTITAATGPDSRSLSAMTLGANLSLGNAAVAGAYTVFFWRTAGITTPALPALTDYGTSGTWSLSYVTGAGCPANVVVNGVGSSIFDLRIYSGDVTTYAENLYNDVVRNAGKALLPSF
jgi:PKD repeat protein